MGWGGTCSTWQLTEQGQGGQLKWEPKCSQLLILSFLQLPWDCGFLKEEVVKILRSKEALGAENRP